MGVVGMLTGLAGLTGDEAATGLGRVELMVLAGTAGGVVVGLSPIGTAGVAPGVAGVFEAEVTGVAFGEAALPGTLVETGLRGVSGVAGLLGVLGVAGLLGVLGVAGLPGTLGKAGLPGTVGVAGLLGTVGVAGRAGAGDTVVGLLLGLELALGWAGTPGLAAGTGPTGTPGHLQVPCTENTQRVAVVPLQ